MKTPAQFFNHPLHPMLVSLPLGLWAFSFICDVAYHFLHASGEWSMVAYYTLIGGLLGALVAAVPGFIDYLSAKNKDPRIKAVGAFHLILNLIVIALYALNAWLRTTVPASHAGFALSALGIALLSISGWLGAELVYKHGVGVDRSKD